MKRFVFMLFAAVQMMTFSVVSAHEHERFHVPLKHDTLTATVEVDTGIFSAPAGSTITPYLSTPDGYVLTGSATLISSLPANLAFPAVRPVVAGTYTYGLLTNGSSISVSPDTLPVIIHSATTNVSTITNIFIPAVSLTTVQAQFNAPFVYNAPTFP